MNDKVFDKLNEMRDVLTECDTTIATLNEHLGYIEQLRDDIRHILLSQEFKTADEAPVVDASFNPDNIITTTIKDDPLIPYYADQGPIQKETQERPPYPKKQPQDQTVRELLIWPIPDGEKDVELKTMLKATIHHIPTVKKGTNKNGPWSVCKVVVADETGHIFLTLWNKQIDFLYTHNLRVGDHVDISVWKIEVYEGKRQILIGPFGRVLPLGQEQLK